MVQRSALAAKGRPRPGVFLAPSMDGVVPPARIELGDPDAAGLSVADCVDATGADRRVIRDAIHDGKLPAWVPGMSFRLGFRVHRLDLEAWWFSDPTRAHTPGTGSPDGPR